MTSMPSFDPSSVEDSYGTWGINAAGKMNNALAETHQNLGLSFNGEKREFTILNSSQLTPDFVIALFAEKNFQVLIPKVQENRDDSGNLIIKLEPDSSLTMRSTTSKVDNVNGSR